MTISVHTDPSTLGSGAMPNNILFIMADQLRADWVAADSPKANTPNLDELAKDGTVFSRALCNGPVCAPSRASIAAGIYPFRFGATSNRNSFPADQPTVYQALRRAGYQVGLVGKMDLHKPDHYYGPDGTVPLMSHLGFTHLCETEGKMNAGRARSEPSRGRGRSGERAYDMEGDWDLAGPYQRYLQQQGWLEKFVRDTEQRKEHLPVWHTMPGILPDELHHDRFVGRSARLMMDRLDRTQPWFLCVSFVGPHDPWDAPGTMLQHYANHSFGRPIFDEMKDKPDWVRSRQKRQSGGMPQDQVQEICRHYAANLTVIDEEVGALVAAIRSRGELDQTTIVFTSDHGEMLGDHGLFQKAIMYEGALRVPLIVKIPGQAGATSNAMAELVDLYPTLLDIAGVAYDPTRLDGRSLLPVLRRPSADHKAWQVSHLERCRMISDGRFKLIDHVNDAPELYDLDADPDELQNVSGSASEPLHRLQQAMRSIYRGVDAWPR